MINNNSYKQQSKIKSFYSSSLQKGEQRGESQEKKGFKNVFNPSLNDTPVNKHQQLKSKQVNNRLNRSRQSRKSIESGVSQKQENKVVVLDQFMKQFSDGNRDMNFLQDYQKQVGLVIQSSQQQSRNRDVNANLQKEFDNIEVKQIENVEKNKQFDNISSISENCQNCQNLQAEVKKKEEVMKEQFNRWKEELITEYEDKVRKQEEEIKGIQVRMMQRDNEIQVNNERFKQMMLQKDNEIQVHNDRFKQMILQKEGEVQMGNDRFKQMMEQRDAEKQKLLLVIEEQKQKVMLNEQSDQLADYMKQQQIQIDQNNREIEQQITRMQHYHQQYQQQEHQLQQLQYQMKGYNDVNGMLNELKQKSESMKTANEGLQNLVHQIYLEQRDDARVSLIFEKAQKDGIISNMSSVNHTIQQQHKHSLINQQLSFTRHQQEQKQQQQYYTQQQQQYIQQQQQYIQQQQYGQQQQHGQQWQQNQTQQQYPSQNQTQQQYPSQHQNVSQQQDWQIYQQNMEQMMENDKKQGIHQQVTFQQQLNVTDTLGFEDNSLQKSNNNGVCIEQVPMKRVYQSDQEDSSQYQSQQQSEIQSSQVITQTDSNVDHVKYLDMLKMANELYKIDNQIK